MTEAIQPQLFDECEQLRLFETGAHGFDTQQYAARRQELSRSAGAFAAGSCEISASAEDFDGIRTNKLSDRVL